MKTEQLTLNDVAAHAAHWGQPDLQGLKVLAENLLKATSAEERGIPALHALMQGSKGGGYFEDKIINGKSYRYLRYRIGKKLRSIYMGRTESFVSRGSRSHQAAKCFRESSRVLCRLLAIPPSLNPITPLDVAIWLTDPERFSPQIARILDGKPPQRKGLKKDLI